MGLGMAFKRFLGLGGVLTLAVFCFAIGAAPARADDVNLTTSFSCLGSVACEQQFEHEEAEPFKGWANLTLTNTGTEAWGDLHLMIFEVPGFGSVENVDFIVSAPFEPTKDGSSTGLTWVVDNVTVGATLDLFFYSDPVLPTETVSFSIYTDNTTDQLSFFGLAFYPTPVPEPSTALLLAGGLIGLAIRGRRHRA
jgi:hypothetical protein